MWKSATSVPVTMYHLGIEHRFRTYDLAYEECKRQLGYSGELSFEQDNEVNDYVLRRMIETPVLLTVKQNAGESFVVLGIVEEDKDGKQRVDVITGDGDSVQMRPTPAIIAWDFAPLVYGKQKSV